MLSTQNNPEKTVSYKVYIKNDYKPVIRPVIKRRWPVRCQNWLLVSSLPVLLVYALYSGLPDAPGLAVSAGQHKPTTHKQNTSSISPVITQPPRQQAELAEIHPRLPARRALPESQRWHEVTISKNDNLSLIFKRHQLSPTDLHNIVSLNEDTARLQHLLPGQRLMFTRADGEIQQLKYEPDLTTTLLVSRSGGQFSSQLLKTALTVHINQAEGVIHDSLFMAGQAAGLTDRLVMQLAAIYGWDIDFVLDIRKGDSFKVVYEEQYKADTKVADGAILVAEFINRGNRLRAVRYQNQAGEYDYYTDEGLNMRKTFLRTPLNFTRISSHFNLRRKHPVLNTMRAHRGVDYAAPSGTPVKAAGNGVVHYAGRKGGYGKTIILRHGGSYSTLYAHLSGYSKGLRHGQTVKQGQIIGYVGSTGLSTGPHLHYEFRINGVHRNPLTVKLPKAQRIPAGEMPAFKQASAALLALLDTDTTEYARLEQRQAHRLLALQED